MKVYGAGSRALDLALVEKPHARETAWTGYAKGRVADAPKANTQSHFLTLSHQH